MELGIVIPLKSKRVSKDWTVTCRNLEMTINSVRSQTAENYRAVVIGHECPDFMAAKIGETGKIIFQTFDELPPPKIDNDENENQLKYEIDRCTKILKGIMYLRSKYPSITHWFALDADDLLHRNFVKSLLIYQDFDAIILDLGYFYFKSSGIINKTNEFSAYCGSSAVIANRLFELPEKITETSFRMIPFGNFSHVNMRKRLVERGHCVATAKERIIMYVRDNGENISNIYLDTTMKKLKRIIKMIFNFHFRRRSVIRHFSLKI